MHSCSKACYSILSSADTRCELLKVVPIMEPQDHVPSSTFHSPYKQQKYGHRQSLGGDSGLFHSLHVHRRAGGRHQLNFLPNERGAFSQQNLDRCNRRRNSRSMRLRALKIYLINHHRGRAHCLEFNFVNRLATGRNRGASYRANFKWGWCGGGVGVLGGAAGRRSTI
jgi:hypothetical protein